MSLFDLDYNLLAEIGNKTYKYSEVKHLLRKVAFNVVKFDDGAPDELWEVMQADDGDYIVARYNADDESAPAIKQASTKSLWEAVVKKGSSEINLFYKGVAITKFAHDDADTLKNILPSKLSNDQHFVDSLFASLPLERQKEIKKLYPELF